MDDVVRHFVYVHRQDAHARPVARPETDLFQVEPKKTRLPVLIGTIGMVQSIRGIWDSNRHG
jgi:hypothetical protein